MSKNRNLDRGDVMPASWTDAIQEFIGTSASANLRLSLSAANVVQIVAGTNSAQVAVGIDGLWRYRSTSITATVSGTAGVKDIFVTATANSYAATPAPDTDNTVYDFGLEVLATGSTPVTGGVVAFRKIGEADWDGTTNITGLRQTVGSTDATQPITATAPRATVTPGRFSGVTGQSTLISAGIGTATTFSVSGVGAVAASSAVLTGTLSAAGATFTGAITATGQSFTAGTVNATALQISGVALASTHLSDTAALARLASPALTGTPTSPTAAADTSTSQIATTGFVLGQASAVAPLMDGVAAVGTSLRYSRQDHVHATDTSRAPLASPTLTGTPAAPTAAVDTNTTQIATTAYVIGQGYLKSATAASTYLTTASAATTYQPLDADLTAIAALTTTGFYVNTSTTTAAIRTLVGSADITITNADGVAGNPTFAIGTPIARLASPTFTGTPVAPTAAGGTNTTQIATTAFVVSALAPYAPLASPGLTGTPTAPTATSGTNTTQIATTQFVTAAVAASTPTGVAYLANAQTFTGLNNFNAGIDVGASAATLNTGQTGAVGDKILLYGGAAGSSYGFGVQGSTVVTYMPSTAVFAVRTANATGHASSGANAVSLGANGVVNVTSGYQINGAGLSAANLSNGTTGTGSVVLAGSPAFSGTPNAPTATAGTSTTQIATTAFVSAAVAGATSNGATTTSANNFTQPQTFTTSGDAANVRSGGAALDGSYTIGRTSREGSLSIVGIAGSFASGSAIGDVVLRVDSVGSSLHLGSGTGTPAISVTGASATLRGTPTAPTAAADTNTTQIATTAYVVGQAYLKQSVAGTTYQPLDGDLTAIAAITATGFYVNTSTTTAAVRTITGSTDLTVTNGDGVAGNPTLTVAASVARLASPTFTGTPSAPTAAGTTNTTQIATTAFVAVNFLKSSTASTTYAPLDNPVFTGNINTSGSINGNSLFASVAAQVNGNITLGATGAFIQRSAASASTTILAARAAADTFDRWAVAADGGMSWGPGSAALDTTLSRASPNLLATGGGLNVGGNLSLSANGAFIQRNASAATTTVVAIQTAADTIDRFAMDASGKMIWGPGGAAAVDTNLYRSAADTLKNG